MRKVTVITQVFIGYETRDPRVDVTKRTTVYRILRIGANSSVEQTLATMTTIVFECLLRPTCCCYHWQTLALMTNDKRHMRLFLYF